MSGELEGDIAEEFINIISEIGSDLEKLNSNNYGSEVEEIAIIPIVVNITPNMKSWVSLKKESF